jgi:hypothetical protein
MNIAIVIGEHKHDSKIEKKYATLNLKKDWVQFQKTVVLMQNQL